MTDRELIQALREDAEWAAANEWETPITLSDNLAEAAKRIEALVAENEHLREVTKMLGKDTDVPTKWVSVEERLPECVGYYLVILDGTREMAVLFFDKWPLSWTDDDDVEYNVTHWMPAPCRPEGVE